VRLNIILGGEVDDMANRLYAFLQRKSVTIGTPGQRAQTRKKPDIARPMRKKRIFGPKKETIQQKAARHFGQWESDKGDETKHRSAEPAPEKEQVCYLKSFGSTDFRIETVEKEKAPPSFWDWAKIAYRRAFGLEID
jgi:hypothetical protein